MARPDLPTTSVADRHAWAASGAMSITGWPQRPLGPPAGLVSGVRATTAELATASERLGRRVEVDGLALLAERAALRGLTRRGQTSCGGGSRLLPTSDGWLAITLSRPDDWDLMPAWLGITPAQQDWDAVASAVRRRPVADLAGDGAVLGLPVAALPERSKGARHLSTALGGAESTASAEGLRVVDLSSLWAGPLCGSLLAAAGADVVKVESTVRPDGARRGDARFFDLMNGGKRGVAFDFRTADGRAQLADLVAAADVVIEGSRPRALEQLGIDAAEMVRSGPRVWVSITGHGRWGSDRDRVGFGDDAAVAGGLVVWDGDRPCFCADAVADPLAGLNAAAAALSKLVEGGRWLLDLSLADIAADHAGPTVGVDEEQPAEPRARAITASAPNLGQDTDAVLSQWLDR